jgi:methyl-accepting chemotaxis protein
MIAPLAAKLATGFTGVLTSVLEDIHRYAGDQIQVVAKSLQEHIENMETDLRGVAGVGERLELLASEQGAGLHSVRQGQEELWSAVRALQQADREQNESISRVTAAADQLSSHLVNHVDAVASRFGALEERVSVLDQFAQEMPMQLDGLAARLDGHTETLRQLEQRQTRRVSTLNQVLDSLARLKESETLEQGVPAVA